MRIGLVVQRYGETVAGGAELHARWIAQRLARRHQVEVLTTCATDYVTWENFYPPGPTTVAEVPVRRFVVARRRTPEGFDALSAKVSFFEHTDEEERRWIEEHGPVTPALLDYLRAHQHEFDALIFFSYRYWTTFHGLEIAPEKSILVPTAEEDETVRLRIFKPFFRKLRAYAFNSIEERELLLRMTGVAELSGEVVGVGIEDAPVVGPDEARRRLDLLGEYIIYVGRIERAKGMARLFDDFLRFVQERRPHLNLALIGRPALPIPVHVNITHLGAVADSEKLSAIGAARLLIHPSPFESLSMALLEAWKMQRPALVNGRCAVLRGQVLRAGGGLYYNGYEEFAETLSWLLDHPDQADAMGRSGQRYFEQNYSWDVIMAKYQRLLEEVAGR